MPWVQGSWVCQWCIYTAVGHTSTDINLVYTAVGYDRPISLLAYPTIGYSSSDINLAYITVGYARLISLLAHPTVGYASSETDLVYTAFRNIGFNTWGAG